MGIWDAGVARFLDRLGGRPKAELHLHLEGAVRPSTAVELSLRSGRPRLPSLAAFRARQRFASFRDFLALYRDICRSVRSPADYALLARDLTRHLTREGITRAEVYVSPAVVEAIGLPWVPVRDALEMAFASFEARTGGTIGVLLDSVRHFGPAAAQRVLDLHEASPWGRAVGFGLGGDELSVPLREFRAVYARLPGLGLAPLVHAGEWGGAASVAEALDELEPVRIAHGIRAWDDPALVDRLVASRTVLDVCLASNAATGAVPHRARHPALDLLRAGVTITLGTDDPGLFRTTLAGEYRRLARLGATAAELEAVRAAGFSAALRHPAVPTTRS